MSGGGKRISQKEYTIHHLLVSVSGAAQARSKTKQYKKRPLAGTSRALLAGKTGTDILGRVSLPVLRSRQL